MAMKDYEPESGYNMPPGCYDPPETLDGHTCGECIRFREFAAGTGICIPEVMQAVAEMSAEKAVCELFSWDSRSDRYKRTEEDHACDDFKEVD